ncbi:MAG: hypothetical protein ACFHU9_09765 [Fluviicola sp.]
MSKPIQISLTLMALFAMHSVISQTTREDFENIRRIESKYGTQWSFCDCVVSQDAIHKAVMNENLTDSQFDSLMVISDSVDRHCKAFLTMSDFKTESDRREHQQKVRNCLWKHDLPMERRFRYTNPDHISHLEIVKEPELDSELIKAESYTRLHSLLGVEPVVIYGGYQFHIVDVKTDIEFMFQLKNGKFTYWGPHHSTQTLEVIDTFHDYLYNQFHEEKWVKGYTEFDTDKGHFTCGFMGGELYEELD